MTPPDAIISAGVARERERSAWFRGVAAGLFAGIVMAAVVLLVVFAPARAADGWRAIDGDTLEVLATGERIRLIGVDTPELAARCEAEADAAFAARFAVQMALDEARRVEVRREGRDRYRRTLARVILDGTDLSAALIATGLGRPYQGGRREGWCG